MRLLIVNPFASGVTPSLLRSVERELAPVETVLTERRGHAAEIVADAGEPEAIVVFGGDGTFNEALNGLSADLPVGFVPGGGTSVLPRALGLSRDPVAAARAIGTATPRRISLGRVNGRRFAFSAGIGLDAELVRRVDALGRRADGKRPGDLRFAWTAVRVLAERRVRFDPVLDIEGRGRAAFALVANAGIYSYAGPLPLRIAPEARWELGVDLVAPQRLRAHDVPRLLAYLLATGGQTHAKDFVYGHDLDRIVIRCDEPQALQVDGEDLGDVTDAVFEAERNAVNVLAPPASQSV